MRQILFKNGVCGGLSSQQKNWVFPVTLCNSTGNTWSCWLSPLSLPDRYTPTPAIYPSLRALLLIRSTSSETVVVVVIYSPFPTCPKQFTCIIALWCNCSNLYNKCVRCDNKRSFHIKGRMLTLLPEVSCWVHLQIDLGFSTHSSCSWALWYISSCILCDMQQRKKHLNMTGMFGCHYWEGWEVRIMDGGNKATGLDSQTGDIITFHPCQSSVPPWSQSWINLCAFYVSLDWQVSLVTDHTWGCWRQASTKRYFKKHLAKLKYSSTDSNRTLLGIWGSWPLWTRLLFTQYLQYLLPDVQCVFSINVCMGKHMLIKLDRPKIIYKRDEDSDSCCTHAGVFHWHLFSEVDGVHDEVYYDTVPEQ